MTVCALCGEPDLNYTAKDGTKWHIGDVGIGRLVIHEFVPNSHTDEFTPRPPSLNTSEDYTE